MAMTPDDPYHLDTYAAFRAGWKANDENPYRYPRDAWDEWRGVGDHTSSHPSRHQPKTKRVFRKWNKQRSK